MDAKGQDYHLHQSYWTHLEPLSLDDASDLHCLSVSVNWPHRPEDMKLVLQVGQGYIARDSIRRPLGAGMWFEYGQGAAMIGMMMTHPKLQSGGLGHEMLAAITANIQTCRLRLNATGPAWRLYRSAGFRETASVIQYQGTVQAATTPTASELGLRSVEPGDLPAMWALDAAVFGAERSEILEILLRKSRAVVMEEEGRITGFAMCRPFGRGRVIGPLIARSEADAIALAGAFINEHTNGFLRIDADSRHTVLAKYLNRCGLEKYDTVVAMSCGEHFGPENASDHTYALASQALG